MKYAVRLLERADRDLGEIVDYLKQFSIQSACDFADQFERQALLLEDFPRLHEEYAANPTYRKMVVEKYPYVAFYIVDDASKRVSIYRVLHGAQDLKRHL